jgi:hypothetical protein
VIPLTDEEYRQRLLLLGTVFTLTRWKDGKIETFILENEEVTLKELHNDKPEL